MPYAVIDLETTVRNRKPDETKPHSRPGECVLEGGTFAASPHAHVNKICMAGILEQPADINKLSDEEIMEKGLSASDVLRNPGYDTYLENINAIFDDIGIMSIPLPKIFEGHPHDSCVLVGHNIAFDLEYLMSKSKNYYATEWHEFIRNGGRIFDTMIAEYILTGQLATFPSLNECLARRGLPLKKDEVAPLWDDGWETGQILPTLLAEYCAHDVNVTHLLFLKQMEELHQANQYELAVAMMEPRLATMYMESNGLCVDYNHLYLLTDEDERKAKNLSADIAHTIRTMVGGSKTPGVKTPEWLQVKYSVDDKPLPPGFHNVPDRDMNPDIWEYIEHNIAAKGELYTDKLINAFLYGQTVTKSVVWPISDEHGNPVRYKSGDKKGEIKHKQTKIHIKFPGIYVLDPLNIGEQGVNQRQLGDAAIKRLIGDPDDPDWYKCFWGEAKQMDGIRKGYEEGTLSPVNKHIYAGLLGLGYQLDVDATVRPNYGVLLALKCANTPSFSIAADEKTLKEYWNRLRAENGYPPNKLMSAPRLYGTHAQLFVTLLMVDHMLLSLLRKRAVEKNINSFLKPYKKLSFPHGPEGTGKLHCNIMHTQTATGRLACSSPNLQQIPRKRSK